EQIPGWLRKQNLPTVASRHHTGSTVNINTDVSAVNVARLARMETHPDANFVSLRPAMLGKRTLTLGCCRDRIVGRRQRDEEGVAVAVNLVPAMTQKCIAKQPAMIIKQNVIRDSGTLEQPRRTLNIREEESDSPRRGSSHALHDYCAQWHSRPASPSLCAPCAAAL